MNYGGVNRVSAPVALIVTVSYTAPDNYLTSLVLMIMLFAGAATAHEFDTNDRRGKNH